MTVGSQIAQEPVPPRSAIRPGMRVQIVEKQNQGTGALTTGIVKRILTSSPTHPHGIKVMLEDGKVGRVQAILSGADEPGAEAAPPTPKKGFERRF